MTTKKECKFCGKEIIKCKDIHQFGVSPYVHKADKSHHCDLLYSDRMCQPKS